MRLTRLHLEQFRCFDDVELTLAPGLNLLTGANGAGKTSVLEAVYLLAYGRSFRGAVRDGLIRRGESSLRVYAELAPANGETRRLGVSRGVREWQGRLDGESVSGLSQIYRQIATVCFEPGSHALIAAGSELRRRYLDWGLFHVEPDFLGHWRRYQRALKQRNAVLKTGNPDPAGLDAWDAELTLSGQLLTTMRDTYLQRLLPELRLHGERFMPEAGALELGFQRGWPQESPGLDAALRASRARDLVLGHTTVGPHRADWTVSYAELPGREVFSRGQEKLTALVCVLAQATHFATSRGFWPVLCLDDLASELDRTHLKVALEHLSRCPAQVLLTATEAPVSMPDWQGGLARFHVERGQIKRLL